ncbi:MAG: HlyC/CorC family transporter [Chlamydiae bacterium]|nr:HlyC/CorC family transporter [Chlamydiota bacterium]
MISLIFIVILIALLFFSALCSASETALFSLSSLTLKTYQKSSDLRHRIVARLMASPRDVLVTILIMNVFANILVQNTVSSLFGAFPSWILKVGFPLFLTLIFGEVIPKSIALPNHVAVASRVAPFLETATKIFRPIRNPLTKITAVIARVLFFFWKKESNISTDELRHILQISEKTGVLISQESSLIRGVLDLQERLVRERMRPREEILFYSIQDPIDHLIHLFSDLKTTRVPVCDENLDHLLGILSVKRFFFHQNQIQKPNDLLPILKKPYYVPETMKAWSLLVDLRERGEDLAIVVDEYGAVSGLISQEDLIEGVVGEIADLRDEKDLYNRSSGDIIIASGKLELTTFREIFGIPLKTKGQMMTIGGWLTEQLGDIPIAGTKYTNDQFLFYVLEADPNRIRRVYIRKLSRP